MRRFTLLGLFALFAVSCQQSGCATGAAESEEASADLPEPTDRDRRLAQMLLYDRAPVAIRIRSGRFDEVRKRLSEQMPVVEKLPGYRALKGESPLASLRSMAGIEGRDDDRPNYVRVEALGDDHARRAARIGLPMSPADDFPIGLHFRVLLPTESPDRVASSLEDSFESSDVPTRSAVTRERRYVRVDLVHPFDGEVSEARLEHALQHARAAGAHEPEMTSTKRRFLGSDAPLAVYSDVDALRGIVHARRAAAAAPALTGDSRRKRSLAVVRTMLGSSALGMMVPEGRDATADVFVSAKLKGKKGVALAVAGTRTERGRTWYDGTAGDASLPAFADDAFADGDRVLDATAAWDVGAVDEALSDDWYTGDSDAPFTSLGDFEQILRKAGFEAAAAVWSHPEHLAKVLMEASGIEKSLLPSALSIRLARPKAGPQSVVGGLAAKFDVGENGGAAVRDELESIVPVLEERIPFELSEAFEKRDGSLVLKLAVNASPDEVWSDDETRVDTGLDWSARPGVAADVLGATEELEAPRRIVEVLRGSEDVDFETASAPGERRLRLALGAKPSETLRASSSARAVAVDAGPTCLGRLRVQNAELLDRYESMTEPEPRSLSRLVETFDGAARECEGLDEETREWARGRFRWLLGRRAAGAAKYRIEELQKCVGSKSRESDTRTHRCSELRQEGLDAFVTDAKSLKRSARALYTRACELGDDAGCRAKSNLSLPELPEVEK